MTRKDYIAIAHILRKNRPEGYFNEFEVWRSITQDCANLFEEDNNRFDRAKFMNESSLFDI